MTCPFCKSTDGYKRSDIHIVCAHCGKESLIINWTLSRKRRNNFSEGMHGYKKREQRSLGTSGTTHESEHVIGYEVFGYSETRGQFEFARVIENKAPAYQEELNAHRKHIGTGMHSDYRGTGESSTQYREQQRALLEKNEPGLAVQLNQLHYAHQPEFHTTDPQLLIRQQQADQSFANMISNFPPVPFKTGDKWGNVHVSEADKAEMTLARFTARGGTYPSRQQEIEAMKKFGLLPGELEETRKNIAHSLARDQHGIPKDGNCLFHSIWHQLNQLHPDTMGFVTNDDLRKQAIGFLRHDPDLAPLNIITNSYLDAMRLPGTWGGEPEAMALAYVWGTRITVHGPKYSITYNSSATQNIDIYYDGIGHYSINRI